MTSEKHGLEAESLGQFLKRTRIAQGYELEDIGEETRISGSNLKAMEADDFGSLPADAFTRGFYTLYARRLKLDPDDIVARFKAERSAHPRRNSVTSHNPPSHKAAKQVSNMAEPTLGSPLSTIGYVLLLLIILSGGICWYFQINPATFISEKLRGLQEENAPDAIPGDVDDKGMEPASSENRSQGATAPSPGAGSLNLNRDADIFRATAMADTFRPCVNPIDSPDGSSTS